MLSRVYSAYIIICNISYAPLKKKNAVKFNLFSILYSPADQSDGNDGI